MLIFERLREEQERILRDTDELGQRMERPENQERMAESRRNLEETRQKIRQATEALEQGQVSKAVAELDEMAIREKIVADVKQRLDAIAAPYYKRVINATGISLHTGLGRAVLPAKALRQIQEELSGYSVLQSDTGTGKRSKRDEAVEQLLKQLTGAEAATVVNNNAAATSIVLNETRRA